MRVFISPNPEDIKVNGKQISFKKAYLFSLFDTLSFVIKWLLIFCGVGLIGAIFSMEFLKIMLDPKNQILTTICNNIK